MDGWLGTVLHWAMMAGIVVVIAIAVLLVASLLLTAVGFGAAGVIAGSLAAGIQSAIGSVVKGSCFAIMQSIGATCAICGPLGIFISLLIGSALVGGYMLYNHFVNPADTSSPFSNVTDFENGTVQQEFVTA